MNCKKGLVDLIHSSTMTNLSLVWFAFNKENSHLKNKNSLMGIRTNIIEPGLTLLLREWWIYIAGWAT